MQILSKSSSSRTGGVGRSEGKDDDTSPTRPSTTTRPTTSQNTTYNTPQQVYYDLGIRQLKIWLEEDEDKGHEQARIDREEKAREARSTHEEFVKKKNRYTAYYMLLFTLNILYAILYFILYGQYFTFFSHLTYTYIYAYRS